MRALVPTLVAFALVLSVAGAARADTLCVPDAFATIQAAIDAASEGDTVCVHAGVHLGRVRLEKSGVSLVGQEGATVRDTDPVLLPAVIGIGARPTLQGYNPKPTMTRRSEVRNLRIESDFATGVGCSARRIAACRA